jgi:hypothetical protein
MIGVRGLDLNDSIGLISDLDIYNVAILGCDRYSQVLKGVD